MKRRRANQSITQSMKSALPAKSICFPLCPPFWNPDKSRVPQGRAARSNLVTGSQRWTEALSSLWFGPREVIERMFLKRIVHRVELHQVHFDGKLRGNAMKTLIIIISKHSEIVLFISFILVSGEICPSFPTMPLKSLLNITF